MGRFFEDGGWGMWPTMLFGFLLVAAAVFTLLRPERRWSLVVSLGVATFGAGLLGATVGIINTMRFVASAPAEDQLKAMAVGIAESLNNVELGLMIVIPTALACAIASVRAARAASTVGAAAK